MEKIVSLCKRRGFVYQTCEIYGGFANAYSYGPYGTELKNNIKSLWWNMFVSKRDDMIGFDGPILLNPRVWEASGHTSGFNDALVDCKNCKNRFRADHLIEESIGKDFEGDVKKMNEVIKKESIKCPVCGKNDWTEVRFINAMFRTEMNSFDGDVYLRPETAGAIFADYKSIIDSMRVKIPFGIAQIGKAFRNEIIARNFIFRVREFEQMEIEYFIHPKTKWEPLFEEWLRKQEEFAMKLGIKKKDLRRFEHPKEKLSHYSKKTIDIEYNFPFKFTELFGLAHRSDFDLKTHQESSGKDLSFTDTQTGEKYIPHVLEPTFGLDRAFLATICSAYTEEDVSGEKRVVLKIPRKLAPVKVAVFPLLKNKPELVKIAKDIYDKIKEEYVSEFDDNGNIGKRYRRQDEIGTPLCVTIDFDTPKKNTVTVRDRDTMKQELVDVKDLAEFIRKKLKE
ncbi:MAG: glycine--tRNA ligase [Patescibacteria group bacterium]|nr:glycine--tRNA ligase [Patescibacteria group bacterium]